MALQVWFKLHLELPLFIQLVLLYDLCIDRPPHKLNKYSFSGLIAVIKPLKVKT